MESRLALATPHEAATAAGREAFERGGNAFDACIAAAASLTVVYPYNCALGGDLIALVQRSDGTRLAINASGPAAAEVDVDALREADSEMPLRGAAPVTVPGLIGGLGELWACGAALDWSEEFVAAIRQARDGVVVVPSLAAMLSAMADDLYGDAGCREILFRDGSPLGAGDLLRQPALAESLEMLAAGGPEAFYRGPIGQRLIDGLRRHGSHLSLADLAGFAPELTAPLVGTLGDAEVATAPPNSQGFLLPLILDAADRLDERFDPLGPRAGELAEIFRTALSVRERYLCDPAMTDASFEPGSADIDLLSWTDGESRHTPKANGDTVAIVAADSAGNTVSLLQSLFHAFGAGILDPETGILVHNRGSFFSLDPNSPNVIAGGKRPAHTLTPCTVFRAGRPEIVLATMGGSGQPQILAEILMRLRLGADPEEAVRAPRWVVNGLSPGARAAEILVEPTVPRDARESLDGLGLPVQILPELDYTVGHAQLITLDVNGDFSAASDPRSEGAAIVVER